MKKMDLDEVKLKEIVRNLESLSSFEEMRDFTPPYCVHILVKMTELDVEFRRLAGEWLKNLIHTRIRDSVKYFERFELLSILFEGLYDEHREIQSTTASVVSSLVNRMYGIDLTRFWPGLFRKMVTTFNSHDTKIENRISMIRSMRHIIKHSSEYCDYVLKRSADNFQLSTGEDSQIHEITNFLIPLVSHQRQEIVKEALSIIHLFSEFFGEETRLNIPKISNSATKLILENSSSITNRSLKKTLIRVIGMILRDRHQQNFRSRYDVFIPFVLECCTSETSISPQEDDSDSIVFETTEFWNGVLTSSNNEMKRALYPHLKIMIPIILNSMIISQSDRDYLDSANLKEKGKDELYGEADIGSEWNLRRSASSCLDNISSSFFFAHRFEMMRELITFLGQEIFKRITNEKEWWICESGILALGAISKCQLLNARRNIRFYDEVVHILRLESSFKYLVDKIIKTDGEGSDSFHSHPNIRTLFLWTISRYYSSFIFPMFRGLEKTEMSGTIIKFVLEMVQFHHFQIRDSANSCLSTIIQELGGRLGARFQNIYHEIARVLGKCLQIYPKKSLSILFDSIATLVDTSGIGHSEMMNPSLPIFSELISPLTIYFEKLVNEEYISGQTSREKLDTVLISLMQCMSSILFVSEDICVKLSNIWDICLEAIRKTFFLIDEVRRDPTTFSPSDIPNSDVIVAAFDSLNSLVLKFGEVELKKRVVKDDYRFLKFLVKCLKHRNQSIKTVAFGLLGDLVRKAGFDELVEAKMTDEIMEALCDVIAPNQPIRTMPFPVVNNAIWSLGYLSLQKGWPGMARYLRDGPAREGLDDEEEEENEGEGVMSDEKEIDRAGMGICSVLSTMITSGQQLREDLKINLVVTVARISRNYGYILKPLFRNFCRNFCMFIRLVRDQEEIIDAFDGLSNLLISLQGERGGNQTIQNMYRGLFPLVMCGIADTTFTPPIIRTKLMGILKSYRTILGTEWQREFDLCLTLRQKHSLRRFFDFPNRLENTGHNNDDDDDSD